MRLPRKRLLIRGFAAFVGVAFVGLGITIIGLEILDPKTAAGHAAFRFAYSFPSKRPAALRFYHWDLDHFNAGYIPTDTNEFLADRLRQCRGTREWTDILDFELAQSCARWGDAIACTDDETKGEIIRDLMQRSAADRSDLEILMLVESLREGAIYHKAQFMKPYVRPEIIDPIVRERYRTWWSDGSAWPANKNTNPLRDTGINIFAP